jgi:hypothetical protein
MSIAKTRLRSRAHVQFGDWKQGIRDLVMKLCCALHNFQVRLTPWQPMI